MENILKVFLMAFPEWLACIFMMVGLVVTALPAGIACGNLSRFPSGRGSDGQMKIQRAAGEGGAGRIPI